MFDQRCSFVRMNLKVEKVQHCRGQCYDGASSMSGAKEGVAKKLFEEEPHAVFTHCYGHALNLAVSDFVKQCKVMKSAFDVHVHVVTEVSKLIKKFPKRDAMFEKIKPEEPAPETPWF